MRLNFAANRFTFGRTNREIVPRTFSVTVAGGELPKCVWISRQTASLMDAQVVELRYNIFFKTASRELRHASESHGKRLRFRTHKLWKCAYSFFCKTRRQRTFKIRLNSTANNFVFGRINRENAPRTFFYKACKAKLPKCVWTSQQTASFLDAQIEKLCPELFL